METLAISLVVVNSPVQKNLYLRPPVAKAYGDFLERVGKKQHSMVGTAAILMFLSAPDEQRRGWIEKVGATLMNDEGLQRLVDDIAEEADVRITESEPLGRGEEAESKQETPPVLKLKGGGVRKGREKAK